MNNSKPVITAFKIIGLLILDILTMLIVFNVWKLNDYDVSNVALLFIFIALFLINACILLTSYISRWLGLPATSSLIYSSVIFYLATMAFTALNYDRITPTWYSIIALIMLLVYVAVVAGLYFSGTKKSEDIVKQENEKSQTADIKILMLSTRDTLKRLKGIAAVADADVDLLGKAVEKAFERIDFGTPFGRIGKDIIIKQEKLIAGKIEEANSLLANSEQSIDVAAVISIFDEIYNLAVNKEKLISN